MFPNSDSEIIRTGYYLFLKGEVNDLIDRFEMGLKLKRLLLRVYEEQNIRSF